MDYARQLKKVIESDEECREDFVIAVAALAIIEKLDDIRSDLSSLMTEVGNVENAMRGE